MSKEIKISVLAESWLGRWNNREDRRAMLVGINRIMCQIVNDQAEETINDGEAFDMLLTLTNLSMFIESLGE